MMSSEREEQLEKTNMCQTLTTTHQQGTDVKVGGLVCIAAEEGTQRPPLQAGASRVGRGRGGGGVVRRTCVSWVESLCSHRVWVTVENLRSLISLNFVFVTK